MKWIVFEITNDPERLAQRGESSGATALDRASTIKEYFHTEPNADTCARKKAASNPGKQYAVMGIVKIFETTTPKVLEKVLNERGEIVMKAP